MKNINHETSLSSVLMKEYKQNYTERCSNNIENTEKGIENLISIKNITTTISHSFEFYKRTITHPTDMSFFQ